jgi:hypothetical protein
MCGVMARSVVTRASRVQDQQEEITAQFLLAWKRQDAHEFSMEFDRVGPKFIRDRIDPDDQREFIAAFDELVALGCVPKTLATTLFCFCKSYLRTDWSSLIPPYADEFAFPSKEARRGYEKTLRKAAAIAQQMESDVTLAKHVGHTFPEFRTVDLSGLLHRYADLLSAWYPPRKDIVRSYAWALPCLYSKVATRKFQFSLVAQLLEAFGYMPALNRQHRRRDRSRGGYEPPDQSLERNVRNFIDQHPLACKRLEMDLSHDEEKEESRRREELDRWAERDLPMALRDELDPLRWSSVFFVDGKGTPKAQKAGFQRSELSLHPQKLQPGQQRRPRRRLDI